MGGGAERGGYGGKRVKEREGNGEGTFGCVGGFVLAPVSQDFVFDPGHVACVGFVVLFLRPFGHDCVLGGRVGQRGCYDSGWEYGLVCCR